MAPQKYWQYQKSIRFFITKKYIIKYINIFAAIRLQDGSYLLNGNNFINWSGEYKAAGTTFVYRRQSPQNLESFSAAGPLQESIDVMVSNIMNVINNVK